VTQPNAPSACRSLRYPQGRRPCRTCPFRLAEHRDGRPFYGGRPDRAVAAMESIRTTGVEWPCHQDVGMGVVAGSDRMSMHELRDTKLPPRACAGLVTVAEASGETTPGLELAAGAGRYAPRECAAPPAHADICHASLDAFAAAEGAVDTGDPMQRLRWLMIRQCALKMVSRASCVATKSPIQGTSTV